MSHGPDEDDEDRDDYQDDEWGDDIDWSEDCK
jgi:hypothetical protein